MCKEISGRFYFDRFANGTKGKCIHMQNEGLWLTPYDFQHYCGSTQAEWKSIITFGSIHTQGMKKSELQTFKSLLSDRQIINLHLYSCTCALCSDCDYIRVSLMG